MKLLFKSIGLIAVLMATLCSGGLAKAADTIQISPLTYKFEVNAGESKDASLTVRNLSDKALNYAMETENFTDIDEQGAPVAFEKSDNSGETLADWVSFTTPKEGQLAPNEKKTINFTIAIPENISAGGYYAAVFARASEGNENAQLAVAGRVGALVLVTVPGEITKTVQIKETSYPKLIKSLKDENDFSAKIMNTGGTYFDSKVVAEIKPLIGKTSFVDLGTHVLTQRNSRIFEAKWSSKYPLGYYSVTFKAQDGNGKDILSTGHFWALPYEIVIPAALILIAIIASIIILVVKRRKKI